MRSGPAAAMGSDHRNEARKKAFVSKALHHAFVLGDRQAPGPGQYVLRSGVRRLASLTEAPLPAAVLYSCSGGSAGSVCCAVGCCMRERELRD